MSVAVKVAVIVCVPGAWAGVTVTEHVAVPNTVCVRVHVPAATSVPTPTLIPTVPVGVNFVPFRSVSLTVTATVLDCPVTTVAGVRLTLVEVERVLTVSVFVSELPVWTAVAPNIAVTVCVPGCTCGVIVTVHVAVPSRVCASAHVPATTSVPTPTLIPTVPVGVTFVPFASVSITVTVTVLAWFTSTVDGDRLTLVEVERVLTVSVLVSELPVWAAVAPNIAVTVCVPGCTCGVIVTVHVAVPSRVCASAHVPATTSVPTPTLIPTVPVGVTFVPFASVSITVTVTVLAWFTSTVDGDRLTLVEVERVLTVSVLVSELPVWAAVAPNIAV